MIWATTSGSAATPWKASTRGNDTGPDQQTRATPSLLNPCIQGFEVGVHCAAAAALCANWRCSTITCWISLIAIRKWPRETCWS